MRLVTVTTIDNPFDPFDQFEEWNAFDVEKGYNTLSYLARIADYSSELSENAKNEAIERAVDEICSFNVLGIYKKFVKNEPEEAPVA